MMGQAAVMEVEAAGQPDIERPEVERQQLNAEVERLLAGQPDIERPEVERPGQNEVERPEQPELERHAGSLFGTMDAYVTAPGSPRYEPKRQREHIWDGRSTPYPNRKRWKQSMAEWCAQWPEAKWNEYAWFKKWIYDHGLRREKWIYDPQRPECKYIWDYARGGGWQRIYHLPGGGYTTTPPNPQPQLAAATRETTACDELHCNSGNHLCRIYEVGKSGVSAAMQRGDFYKAPDRFLDPHTKDNYARDVAAGTKGMPTLEEAHQEQIDSLRGQGILTPTFKGKGVPDAFNVASSDPIALGWNHRLFMESLQGSTGDGEKSDSDVNTFVEAQLLRRVEVGEHIRHHDDDDDDDDNDDEPTTADADMA
jgi:hypothetical protein